MRLGKEKRTRPESRRKSVLGGLSKTRVRLDMRLNRDKAYCGKFSILYSTPFVQSNTAKIPFT